MIHQWGDRQLGENASTGEQLVLLLRGELLQRYPNSVIYAVQAVRKDGKLELSTQPDAERHPLFRGTLKPDVTFLGFHLTRDEALAEPGWFFVIQQQPTEPSFGLDVADFEKPPPPPDTPPLTKWDDPSWRHLANTEEALRALSHVSIEKKALPTPPREKATWGRHAAHQAYITLQRPVRIAIHASTMLPPN